MNRSGRRTIAVAVIGLMVLGALVGLVGFKVRSNATDGKTLEELAGVEPQASFNRAVEMYFHSAAFQADAGVVKSFKETGSTEMSNSFLLVFERRENGGNFHYETDREAGTLSIFAESTGNGWNIISMKRFPDAPAQGS